ncbi:MAG TPA: cohesin domain-containing protein, partial [Thermoanaerobaculia bacterium]|nr:cohesin domain-containing protein [Thermoanaerobaculia bacterium]
PPPDDREPPGGEPLAAHSAAARGAPSRAAASTAFAQGLAAALLAGEPGAAQPPASGRRVRRLEVPPASLRGAGVGTVTLSPQPATLTVDEGASFEIRLAIASQVQVSHLPTEIRFDATRLRFDNERSTPFFDAGATTETLTKVIEPGRLVLGASRLGAVSGVSGEGVVLRLFFKALAAGLATIELTEVRPLGPDLAQRSVEYSPRTVAVTILPPDGPDGPDDPPSVRTGGRRTGEGSEGLR